MLILKGVMNLKRVFKSEKLYTQSENTYRYFNKKYKESIIELEKKYAHVLSNIDELQSKNIDLNARILVLEFYLNKLEVKE